MMIPPRTKKLFISYRSSDAAKVDKIAKDLSLLKYDDDTSRYRTWQDKIDLPPGSPNWWDAIVDAIIDCDMFVFNLSYASLQSEVCLAELDYAHRRNRPIISVVLDGEFVLNEQSDKYDLPKETWELVPKWLKERQFLFYTGADFNHQFQTAVRNFERDWPQDIPIRRPLGPDLKSQQQSNHALYDEGCDLAWRLAFIEAEKRFLPLVERNDEDYKEAAIEWLKWLDMYVELIGIDARPHAARFAFKTKWTTYAARFPNRFLDGIFDPKHFATRKWTDEAKAEQESLEVENARHEQHTVQEPTQPQKHSATKRTRWLRYSSVAIGLGTVLFLLVVGMIVLNGLNGENTLPPTTAIAQDPTAMSDNTIPTLSGFQQLQTTEAEQTQVAGIQAAFDLTATEQFISDNNATATAQQLAITETSAHMTLIALSATPTLTPTLSPEEVAVTPVTNNASWTPYERDFNGVTMVLVPAGCFMMGSDDGEIDEKPIHEQCFDQHFWIDKYEVTLMQFRQLGGVQANPSGFTGDDRPVERITWFESRDFCKLRGMRLPTEAEWEYAARGPNSLTYPWGNEFNAGNVVYYRNSNSQTSEVGSRPGGVSWVGALDMSGNVWEWVSSLYQDYPYSDNHESDSNTRDLRVLRGGSWNFSTGFLRTASRSRNYPDFGNSGSGFRCVHDYEVP